MAVPNPNQITSVLRMMGDTQLAQYAAMHKNDPYIFPMAFEESNMRKQVRAQEQAKMAGQPQQKVADQALAAMAPEDSGIGALAAPNMQHMADGGIAGYADGGEFNYSGADDGPLVRMAEGGIAHFQQGGQSIMRNTTPYGGVMGDIPGYVPGDTSGMPQVGSAEDLPFIQRKTREAAEAVRDGTATPQQKALVNWANRLGFGTPELKPRTAMPTQSPESDWPTNKPAAAANTQTPPDLGNRPPAPPSMRGPSAPPSAVAPEQSAAQRYAAMQKEMGLNDTQKLDTERADYAASLRKAAADEKAAFERDMAERGKYGEAREARLSAREAGLGKEKEQMTGLALLEAGLGIMSTPGTLAQAIGKGAKEGLKSYGEGLAKLKLAQERIDESRDSIEDFRRNEANMTATERRKFESQIGRTESEIKKLAVDAAKDMYGYKQNDLKAVFSAATQERLTDKEIKSKENIAAMHERGADARATMPSGEMRTAMMLGTGTTDAQRLESGMKKLQEITADKSGMAAVKLLAETNAGRAKNGEPPITMQDLLGSAREYSALMYPKVADIPKTNMLAR
jgi:hypothetical protein